MKKNKRNNFIFEFNNILKNDSFFFFYRSIIKIILIIFFFYFLKKMDDQIVIKRKIGLSDIQKRRKHKILFADNRIVEMYVYARFLFDYELNLEEFLNKKFPSLFFEKTSSFSTEKDSHDRPLLFFIEANVAHEPQAKENVLAMIGALKKGTPMLIIKVFSNLTSEWKLDRVPDVLSLNSTKDVDYQVPVISIVRSIDNFNNGTREYKELTPEMHDFNTLSFIGLSQWLAAATGADEVTIPRPKRFLSNPMWRDRKSYLVYLRNFYTNLPEDVSTEDAENMILTEPKEEEYFEPVFDFGLELEKWKKKIQKKCHRGKKSSKKGAKKSKKSKSSSSSSSSEESQPSTSGASGKGILVNLKDTRPGWTQKLLDDEDYSSSSSSSSSSSPVSSAKRPSASSTGEMSSLYPGLSMTSSSSTSPTSSAKRPPASSTADMGSVFPGLSLTSKPAKVQRLNEEIGFHQEKLGELMQQLRRVNMGEVQHGFTI